MNEYTILFLDFDGVLHPVHQFRHKSNCSVFEFLPVLENALSNEFNIRIILSTSWVETYGYEMTKSFLPGAIGDLVIGSTMNDRFGQMTRYQQIKKFVDDNHLTKWIAIDDDDEGWAHDDLDRFIKTDPEFGIRDLDIMSEFDRRII